MSICRAIYFRRVSRLAATGLAGLWLAGCSADSIRLSQGISNPFGNPFSSASNEAAPTPAVVATPLAQNGGAVAPVAVAPLAPAQPTATASAATPGSSKGWSAIGGSPVIVAQGDTLDGLSRRYGVPSDALLKANGLTSASQIHSGVRLTVPVYSASASETTLSVKKKKSVEGASVADAAPTVKAKAKKKIDDPALADAAPDAKSKPKKKAAEELAKQDPAKAGPAPVVAKATPGKVNTPVLSASAAKTKPAIDPTQTASLGGADAGKAGPATSAQADAQNTTPEFRWPARGRIIEGFKVGANDGINISVPEGTSVRAAESGVVAYSGDGLKGYGNLVLIRHPNGYVTAYANNGSLSVKSGETVKRGQIIAMSGQTGNVNSPQLHFELRKGKTPVDPTSYLAGL